MDRKRNSETGSGYKSAGEGLKCSEVVSVNLIRQEVINLNLFSITVIVT